LERLPSGSRIAVIRLRSLGDCVLTTPALSLLKSHRPDLRIGVVVEDRFAGVFEGNPDVDEILPPQASAVSAFRPIVALNLHGGTRSMALTMASRAAVRAGFAHHAYSLLYNVRIPRAQEILGVERKVHTAEHIASAMFWIGVPQTEIPRARLFAGYVADALARAAPPLMATPGVSASEVGVDTSLDTARTSACATETPSYAVLHPFASAPEKTWTASGFLGVARHLKEHAGLEPVFLAGPRDGAAGFAPFRVLHNAPLGEVKSLLADARIFIGNDSGPAHVAAAFGVPVVVLFGPSDPVHWAPWRTESQVITSAGPIEQIRVEQVIAAANALRVTA
jgi:ADP-heptose:LPS heptosyltransferase